MADAVLAVNAGSSSIKFALFEIAAGEQLTAASRGQIEGIGSAPHFIARDPAGAVQKEQRFAGGSHEDLLGALLGFVDAHLGIDALRGVGHRIVHGGSRFSGPARIDAETLAAIEALMPLAPLHQPHSISPIRAIAAARPVLPQIACFDTAFHHDMPAVAARLALPATVRGRGRAALRIPWPVL